MTQPQVSFIYNRRKTANNLKKASIEIRVTYQGKQKYIATGILIYPHQWKDGCIIACPEAAVQNKTLSNILIRIREIIQDMEEEGNIDINQIQSRLEINKIKSGTFLDYCRQRAEIRKYGKKEDTQERYKRFLRMLESYGKILYFSDIDELHIIAYDTYLSKKGMKNYSKWNNYHRFLNSFIMDAIDDGLLKRNPYKQLNITKDKDSKSIEKHLTIEEFNTLQNTTMPTPALEKVRDLFIFQTYTCLSYKDLRCFNAFYIQEIKGMKVYIGKRQKTGKRYTIPLLPKAQKILSKYNNSLPVISNVKYNEYIKKVAKEAGINKNISTHWARHTGATLLLNEGVPMQIVSKICGHSSTRITEQIYARLLDETIVDAVSKIKL